jgi:(2Fe-2S) ferredoxin
MSFYKSHIFCCTNRREPGHSRGCCAEKNSEGLRDYMKARVKELGPCMVIYPEGVWYSCKTKEDIDEVIREHLQGGKVVERLVI